MQLPVLLDSGADISVLPEEVVPAVAKIQDKVRLNGYDGKSKLREVTWVTIRLANLVLQ